MIDLLKSPKAPAQMGNGEATMSEISNLHGVAGARTVQPIESRRNVDPSAPDRPDGGYDTVEISFRAEMLARLRELPDVRIEKVVSIKHAIQNGTYDVDGKLNEAVNRMIEDLDLG
jgi:anti-sigma28 factor (negative regulator of flagellin synthesis)